MLSKENIPCDHNYPRSMVVDNLFSLTLSSFVVVDVDVEWKPWRCRFARQGYTIRVQIAWNYNTARHICIYSFIRSLLFSCESSVSIGHIPHYSMILCMYTTHTYTHYISMFVWIHHRRSQWIKSVQRYGTELERTAEENTPWCLLFCTNILRCIVKLLMFPSSVILLW